MLLLEHLFIITIDTLLEQGAIFISPTETITHSLLQHRISDVDLVNTTLGSGDCRERIALPHPVYLYECATAHPGGTQHQA
jgi:hypothetical protein